MTALEKVVAILPGAGRGSRLGLNTPKALIQPDGKHTLIEILYAKVSTLVDQVIVVVNPEMPNHEFWPSLPQLDVVIQEHPTGMGDAVFCAWDAIEKASIVLVIWVDQYGITEETLNNALNSHSSRKHLSPRVTIPLITVDNPYVEYVTSGNRIDSIKQQREGDQTSKVGMTDVGFFVLDAGRELLVAWESHKRQISCGSMTGERNFLPFLVWLIENNWNLEIVAANLEDRLGINTLKDFEAAQQKFRSESE